MPCTTRINTHDGVDGVVDHVVATDAEVHDVGNAKFHKEVTFTDAAEEQQLRAAERACGKDDFVLERVVQVGEVGCDLGIGVLREENSWLPVALM